LFKYVLLTASLLTHSYAFAASDIEDIQKQLNTFKQTSDAQYAPTTLSRVEAYLGAAMLARDDQKTDDVQAAVEKAALTLHEAKDNATRFITQYDELLSLQAATQEAVSFTPDDSHPTQGSNTKRLLNEADEAFKKVILSAEKGQLNLSQQASASAHTAYLRVLEAVLPSIIEQTAEILASTAAKDGKNYAPITYERAKHDFTALKAYQDGITSALPSNPSKALILAKQALDITNNVKSWRRDKGSHESLLLQARKERQELAQALEIPLTHEDVSIQVLTQNILALRKELNQSKADALSSIEALKQSHQVALAKALEEQRSGLLNERNTELGSMKDAFRAKLERETFENKRQKKIHSLFPKEVVSIIVNLDGSLILRLSKLKFASASSKIDASYFDFLAQVKNAIEIYGDRSIRIEGHTDNLGDIKANQSLSLKRAESVRDFLIAAGIEASNIKALGYGEVRPIASNDFAKGREMNRRIDLVIEARSE